MKTTRTKIAEFCLDTWRTPEEIAEAFGITRSQVIQAISTMQIVSSGQAFKLKKGRKNRVIEVFATYDPTDHTWNRHRKDPPKKVKPTLGDALNMMRRPKVKAAA